MVLQLQIVIMNLLQYRQLTVQIHQHQNPLQSGNYSDITIEPHSSVQATRIDTPIIPEARPDYYVANSGPAPTVRAVFYWSHSFTSEWFESSSIIVKAGEDGILKAPGNSLYYSKVVIYNDTDKRAFVTGYNK
ncbi:JHE-like toxin PirA [Xenorhabdus budapestensis]|uniref:JHE-like toxin PirA n=1 Tax=Xenorhabdus budapestensis TaxID=290110 RepID=A0A2D0J3H4_XENBU|nr:JHE-like toxin PirA [Xenorhabdus budapestensis]